MDELVAELDVEYDEPANRYSYRLYDSCVERNTQKRGELLDEFRDCGNWELAYTMGQAAAIVRGYQYMDVRAVTQTSYCRSVTHTLFPWLKGAE